MKRGRGILLVALGLICGCADSEDGYPSPLLRTGRDARVYNPMTGRFEWPDDPPTRAGSARSGRRAAAREEAGVRPQTGR